MKRPDKLSANRAMSNVNGHVVQFFAGVHARRGWNYATVMSVVSRNTPWRRSMLGMDEA